MQNKVLRAQELMADSIKELKILSVQIMDAQEREKVYIRRIKDLELALDTANQLIELYDGKVTHG